MTFAVRSMLGINLALGSLICAIIWIAAPLAAMRIAASHSELLGECIVSLRIAAVLVLVRAVESVCASTQRAFEAFGANVRINTAMRGLTLATAAALAFAGQRSVSIVAATGIFLALGTVLQFRQASRLLDAVSLWPAFAARETRLLLGFGIFTWVQVLGGVFFGQFDRVFLGVSLGAAAVAPYSLCVQLAHPIFGLTASGLQFLFPYLSRRADSISAAAMTRTLAKAFAVNLALVTCGAAFVLLVGVRIIELWAGAAVARTAAGILPDIVIGSALMGLSVTGIYAMLAFGLVRTFAVIGLASKAAALLLMVYLVRHSGLQGLAASRVLYGIFSLLVYAPLIRRLDFGRDAQGQPPSPTLVYELKEATEP